MKRSATNAKMRLCIDETACPGRHRYELRVSPQLGILITASDPTGLFYGAYSLIQLITLHSDVKMHDGVTTVHVPSISIYDWPDITNRGVLWSYRKSARSTSANMRRTIELLSKLHINQLLLTVDCATEPVSTHSANEDAENSTSAKIYALDEVSRRHCIELIPTLLLTSLAHKVPIDSIRNFSRKTMTLLFLYEFQSVRKELATSLGQAESVVDEDLAAAACKKVCFCVGVCGGGRDFTPTLSDASISHALTDHPVESL